MRRRLLSLTLVLALAAAPALAAGPGYAFPIVNEYQGYADVTDADWFHENAKLCYETGLMTGTDAGFAPHAVMTVAEVAVIADRIHSALTGQADEDAGGAGPWYGPAVGRMEALAAARGDATARSLLAHPEAQATRLGFLKLLSLSAPDTLLSPINAITVLPDTVDADVLRFYNAGILIGVDEYGTFQPGKTLTRAEAAAMVSRLTVPDLRLGFVPTVLPLPCRAAETTPDTVYFQGGGKTVTAGAYLDQAVALIDALEAECAAQGVPFNWFNTYGEQTFLEHVKENSLSNLGVTLDIATDAYKKFDLQVFYSRLLDLRGAEQSEVIR